MVQKVIKTEYGDTKNGKHFEFNPDPFFFMSGKN